MAQKNNKKRISGYKSNYKSKTKNLNAELQKKLLRNVIGLTLLLGTMIIGLLFFGPQIGNLIGWLTGNTKEIVRQDTVPPSQPIFANPPTAVRDPKVKLEGFAEAGAQIKLFVNGPEKMSTTADNEGKFTFPDVELIDGGNSIFAKAIDPSNNESEKSTTLKINVDKDKPEIKISEPSNGSTVENLDKRITIRGSVNEKASLKINEKHAIVRPDLTFEFILGVEEGDVQIKIQAQDDAGNEAEEKIFVKYLKN